MACGAGISKENIKYKSVSEKKVTLNEPAILRLIHYYSPNNLNNILGFLDFIYRYCFFFLRRKHDYIVD